MQVVLPHPCFVYAVKPLDAALRRPASSLLVATGAYDGIIRLWNGANGSLLSYFDVSIADSPSVNLLIVSWCCLSMLAVQSSHT